MTVFKILGLSDALIQSYIKSTAPIKRGIDSQKLVIKHINIRDYSHLKHRKVDDTLYGGGPGLLMRGDVVYEAIQSNYSSEGRILLCDPKGEKWTQTKAIEFKKEKEIVIICGRYEGIDARIFDFFPQIEQISVGDFILTQGEIAALNIIDTIIRLIPGMCHNFESTQEESFSIDSFLEYDQYTKPRKIKESSVPSILLEGNHQKITEWKFKNGIKNLIKNRPEEIKRLDLTDQKKYALILKSLGEYYYDNE